MCVTEVFVHDLQKHDLSRDELLLQINTSSTGFNLAKEQDLF